MDILGHHGDLSIGADVDDLAYDRAALPRPGERNVSAAFAVQGDITRTEQLYAFDSFNEILAITSRRISFVPSAIVARTASR